jgi:hypothetical protein
VAQGIDSEFKPWYHKKKRKKEKKKKPNVYIIYKYPKSSIFSFSLLILVISVGYLFKPLVMPILGFFTFSYL